MESGAYKYACSILKRSSITRFLNNSVEINLNGRNKLQWVNQDYDYGPIDIVPKSIMLFYS